MLLRPDNGMLLPVICAYAILYFLLRSGTVPAGQRLFRGMRRAALVSAVALAALLPWTVRNWRTFHVIQPLAPRYANDPGQFVPLGFQRWVKTWMLDYISVADLYWSLEMEPVDLDKAPSRAFDSEQERNTVQQIFDRYNSHVHFQWRAELDTELGQIAKARIARHPGRYYLWLPAGRILDMWLRPRTEMLGLDDRWWAVDDDPHDALISMTWGAINLGFVAVAVGGLILYLRPGVRNRAGRQTWHWGLLLAFVLLRSLFLGSLENPEPRYTLECYPMILVFAAAALAAYKQGSGATDPLPETSTPVPDKVKAENSLSL